MSVFDSWRRFDDPSTPNIGEAWHHFLDMHAATTGSDEHDDALDRFATAAERLTKFERVLFRLLYRKYLGGPASADR